MAPVEEVPSPQLMTAVKSAGTWARLLVKEAMVPETEEAATARDGGGGVEEFEGEGAGGEDDAGAVGVGDVEGIGDEVEGVGSWRRCWRGVDEEAGAGGEEADGEVDGVDVEGAEAGEVVAAGAGAEDGGRRRGRCCRRRRRRQGCRRRRHCR